MPLWTCLADRVRRHPLLVLLALGALVCACTGNGAVLEAASLSAPRLDASGDGAPVLLRYSVARPARVSVELVGQSGAAYGLRRDEPRAAGSYELALDGTYPLPDDPEQRRILPAGDYLVRLAATGIGGTQQQELPLRVERSDTAAPRIDTLAVYPAVISPNYDGVDDLARITYRLDKRVRAYAYVQTPQGEHIPLGPRALALSGEYATQWDGTRADSPVPDGEYQVVVQATDDAGNVSVARTPLSVQAGGRPNVRILRVDFSPRQLMVGQTVQVAITVKNAGATVARTQGPDPGYVYDSYDSFASIEGHRFVDRAGYWRVGVDWAGAPAEAGSRYAYRWGFGHDLQPGEELTVQGAIRVLHGPEQDAGHGPRQNRLFLYAGLIHEGFDFQEDKVGGTWIELGY
jgi:hypothetical protein